MTGARNEAFVGSKIYLLLVGVDDVVDAVVDAHLVERAPNEEDSHENEDDTYPGCILTEVLADSHFHGEQTEQGGELDDRVQGN